MFEMHMRTPGGLLSLILLVNLNTATIGELDTLPGVGPVIARRIVEFREKRGGFRRVEELLAVQGISERIWQELKDRVEVVGPDTESEPAGDRPTHTLDGAAEKEARR